MPFNTYDELKLRKIYINNMLGISELKVFEVNGERFQGNIQGISTEGALEMLVDGQLKQYVQGEITLVPLGAS
jgi:hypothetical protein